MSRLASQGLLGKGVVLNALGFMSLRNINVMIPHHQIVGGKLRG